MTVCLVWLWSYLKPKTSSNRNELVWSSVWRTMSLEDPTSMNKEVRPLFSLCFAQRCLEKEQNHLTNLHNCTTLESRRKTSKSWPNLQGAWSLEQELDKKKRWRMKNQGTRPPCQTILSFLLWSPYIIIVLTMLFSKVFQWDTTIWLLRVGTTRWPKSIEPTWTLPKSSNQHSAFARGRQRDNELHKVTLFLGPQIHPLAGWISCRPPQRHALDLRPCQSLLEVWPHWQFIGSGLQTGDDRHEHGTSRGLSLLMRWPWKKQ